jgi:cyclase
MQDRIRLLERRDIDELIILDVSGHAPRFDEVKRLTEPLFCPITVGGGINDIEHIRKLLAGGADKVAINRVARERPDLVREASEKFGAQAIVVGMDVRAGDEPEAYAARMESLGAGEILLTSVARDGMMGGYDLDLIRSVCDAVSIPVIAAGGCGSYEHMQQALDAGAHAVASGAMFQFCEATPKGAARFLHEQGIATRL